MDNNLLNNFSTPTNDNEIGFLSTENIRHIIIEDEYWWSIYDLYALAGRISNPTRDWMREKATILGRGYTLPIIKTWHFRNTLNKRARSTPLINRSGVDHIRSI